jgi:hypothetical protein
LAAAVTLGVIAPASASGAPSRGARVGLASEAAVDEAAPTEDEAIAQAKRTGKSVEILSLRGESSEVFATADGRLEAREHLRPVRARVNGVWKAIDTDLAKTVDGMVTPKVATIELQFSGGGDAPMVRMTKAGRELELSWPGTLPVPRIEGDTATYPDVLPGVDLRLGAQEDGFTQLLVVKSAEAAASEELTRLRLELDTKGMTVKTTAEGGLEAVDEGGDGAVFEAPRPMMWDSSEGTSSQQTGSTTASKSTSTARSLAAPAPAAVSAADSASASAEGAAEGTEPGAAESGKLAPVGVEISAGQDELVLRPNAEVLKGEDTVYPVFIDPQWYSPKATAWTMASKYWASSPQWKFNGDPDAGMGFCGWAYCQPQDTKRLFYRLPVSKFAGTSVLSAEFVVRNTWSASCSARGVELWRTKDISTSTTWNSQNASGFWIKQVASQSFAYGWDGCAAKDAEFDVRSAVQEAATNKWATMTFGLQAASETDAYGWKRFSDDAFLRVRYNRPPPQIKLAQLTMEYGGTCKTAATAARIRTLGKIYASSVTDPDGDNVAVQFQAKWDAGDGKGLIARWSPALTSYKKSGSSFTISLPTSIPQNKQIQWYARAYDGAQYSPWSYAGGLTACYFYYDTSAPKPPTISSNDYPATDDTDPEDPWYDGIGKYGTFTLGGNDSQTVKYLYGVNVDPSTKNVITTTSGATKSLKLLPPVVGVNTLYVSSVDAAGNVSAPAGYRFRVKAGQPERATWEMDEGAGATQAEGSSGARVAALHGGATLGAEGKKGSALHLDGTSGYAETDIPTVDTADDFSVSAWVRLEALPTNGAVVAAQPGNHSPGFELYYSAGYNRWVFSQHASDTAGSANVRAMAPQATGVTLNEWTHLVGVYSSGDKQLRLYVNAVLVGTTSYTSAWDARRGLQIGATNLNGEVKSYFSGSIDELHIFDKAVTNAEVVHLHRLEPLGNGRTARAVFVMEDESKATEVVGHADTQPLTLAGDAKLGAPGAEGHALQLDGDGDYARTAAPHLDSQRAFTVSAWAKLDRLPAQAATIVAQLGTSRPGFELYYSKTYNRWGFTQYSGDVVGATQIRAVQPEGTTARVGEWVHLVGVHDTVAQTLTLYVNGVKAASVAQANPWNAGGGVQVGALTIDGGKFIQYFPGQIDDVRLYDRPVSAEEVQQMFRQRPLVKARWTFETASGSPLVVPDASASGNAMTLNGDAQLGSEWVDGNVYLDGVDDFGETSTVPVDTSTSFTVTAWAMTAADPSEKVTLLSVPGTTQSALALRYEPGAVPGTDPGRWRISMADKDTADATVADAGTAQFFSPGQWAHLAVVYDGFAKRLSLYVNGELLEDQSMCVDPVGDGQEDSSDCALPWAENVLAYKATQPMQLGRVKTGASTGAEYWPGAVSDVWAFQGTLTDAQIGLLAAGQAGIPTDIPDVG